MALIKFSAGVGAASGKSGGFVFSRNRGGAYIKAYTIPTNTNTQKQQIVKAVFGTLSTEWRTLTPANKERWTTMAPQYPYTNRVGDVKTYSGQQLFMKVNSTLVITLGRSSLPFPLVPVALTETVLDSVDYTFVANVLTTMAVGLSSAGSINESFVVLATPPMGTGITKPAKSAFKQLLKVGDASTGDEIDIMAEYIAMFGAPLEGDNVFVRVGLYNKFTSQYGSSGQILLSSQG